MPELPEVETAARHLQRGLAGRRLERLEHLGFAHLIEDMPPEGFAALITGKRVVSVRRRAKWLLISLEGGWTLAVHLRMTGELDVLGPDETIDKHMHLVVALDDGRKLVFRDPRRFGRIKLLDAAGLAALESAHGLEPLSEEFTTPALAALLAGRGTRLKPFLLDQHHLAGLGNIYADEALWEARLHPLRTAGSLSAPETERLQQAIREVLARAIEAKSGGNWRYYRTGRDTEGRLEAYFNVYDRADEPCRRCGAPILRTVVGQRGTHTCPVCQPAP